MKPLQIASSDLVFPPKDLVTVSTCFTKVLYAQLKSQRFSAPLAWENIVSQPDDDGDVPQEKSYVQLEMGMKVTSGFEMLITDPKDSDNRLVREVKIILEDLVVDKNVSLPSDQEVAQWKEVRREDDENWLDINFEDFERELQGKSKVKKTGGVPGGFGPEPPSGFGDAKTQADLKKMVERFEAFLNDEDAGVDGFEMDDMDIDNDEDENEDLDDDSEDEDKDVSFDENEFAKMMREMMGMPSEEPERGNESKSRDSSKGGRIEELDTGEEENEDEAVALQKVMQRMEAELNEEGALNLDLTPKKLAALKSKPWSHGTMQDLDSEEESDGEVNIDFNLAKNLLESFKSQAGMAGPGGNLIGMMGLRLPRDEEDANTGKKS
jgi:hypothetical protein